MFDPKPGGETERLSFEFGFQASEVEFHHLCVSCIHNCVKTYYYAGLRGYINYIIFEEQFALDLLGFAENEREIFQSM